MICKGEEQISIRLLKVHKIDWSAIRLWSIAAQELEEQGNSKVKQCFYQNVQCVKEKSQNLSKKLNRLKIKTPLSKI